MRVMGVLGRKGRKAPALLVILVMFATVCVTLAAVAARGARGRLSATNAARAMRHRPARTIHGLLRRPLYVRPVAVAVRRTARVLGSAWDHDYPAAEQHPSSILRELTLIDAHVDESRILTLDDPELFHYPIAFM
jgi:hypothetical protein